MSTTLMKLATQAEGRYLNRDEQQQLLGFANTLPQRFKAAAAVEQKEDPILRTMIDEMKQRYPSFHKYHDQAWAKCYRDVQLVLRYNVQAMIFEDVKLLEDKVLFWFRTILSASNFTPQLVSDCYTLLRESCRGQLPEEAYQLLEPYLQRNIDVLSDFPEPANPAVELLEALMQFAAELPGYNRGNYYAESDYIKTNVRTGVARNRGGTRMIVLSDDFLNGMLNALESECGPAAGMVLKSCGRSWGKRFGVRFEREMEAFYGCSVKDFPMSVFHGCLVSAFSHHGWGKLNFDFSRYPQGVIVVTGQNAIFGSLKQTTEQPTTQPADLLLAGVLAGMFSQLADQELDCVQTACQACGASASQFILTLTTRLQTVQDWPSQGRTHEDVLAEVLKLRG